MWVQATAARQTGRTAGSTPSLLLLWRGKKQLKFTKHSLMHVH